MIECYCLNIFDSCIDHHPHAARYAAPGCPFPFFSFFFFFSSPSQSLSVWTVTGPVAPIRCARAMTCRSTAGSSISFTMKRCVTKLRHSSVLGVSSEAKGC